MKFLEKLAKSVPWQRLKASYAANPKYWIAGLGLTLIVSTYLFSKHQDEKTITYENQNVDFSNARVLSSNQEIYKRKDKIYTDKVQSLEDKLAEVTKKLEELEVKKVEDPVPAAEPVVATDPTAPHESQLPPPVFNHSARNYSTTTVREQPSVAYSAPAPAINPQP
jgi:flavodoxin